MTDERRTPFRLGPAPPAPTWLVWANRALLTLTGVIGTVMVNGYAVESGQALDLALAVAIALAAVVGVLHPTRPVPVMLASLLSMLGLALVPPLWLLALVAPLLLWTHRRRAARREHGRIRGTHDRSPPDPRDAP